MAVIGFEVQLEMISQAISAQKVDTGGRIGIILMFCWFLWFGFDQELSREIDLAGIVDCHIEKSAQVVDFAL